MILFLYSNRLLITKNQTMKKMSFMLIYFIGIVGLNLPAQGTNQIEQPYILSLNFNVDATELYVMDVSDPTDINARNIQVINMGETYTIFMFIPGLYRITVQKTGYYPDTVFILVNERMLGKSENLSIELVQVYNLSNTPILSFPIETHIQINFQISKNGTLSNTQRSHQPHRTTSFVSAYPKQSRFLLSRSC